MMDGKLPFYIAASLALLIGADIALASGEASLFLARKFIDLMDWLEFWR